MRIVVMILLVGGAFLCGCASTIADRRKEKVAAYTQLPPETQAFVDQGQIKVGMPKDAVYIAWGKPDQIVQGESSQGTLETWVYHGTALRPYQYWNYGYYDRPWSNGYFYAAPYLETDYYPVSYVSREVQFENDRVRSWRGLPHPPY